MPKLIPELAPGSRMKTPAVRALSRTSVPTISWAAVSVPGLPRSTSVPGSVPSGNSDSRRLLRDDVRGTFGVDQAHLLLPVAAQLDGTGHREADQGRRRVAHLGLAVDQQARRRRPESAGGAKETGISIFGSDGTSSAVRSAGGKVPGGIPA